jgi:hypothetical protein
MASEVESVVRTLHDAALHMKVLSIYATSFVAFSAFIQSASLATQMALVYQHYKIVQGLKLIHEELRALTGLEVPRKFAEHVYNYLKYESDGTKNTRDDKKHIYFLYHPDTDWHPEFYQLYSKAPISDRFAGISENLDLLCLWMSYLRIAQKRYWAKRDDTKLRKTLVFHLLIPAYRSLVIEDPLRFSEDLQPLFLHGMVHKGRPYVKLNLPGIDRRMLHGVQIWEPPPSILRFLARPKEERMLGHAS